MAFLKVGDNKVYCMHTVYLDSARGKNSIFFKDNISIHYFRRKERNTRMFLINFSDQFVSFALLFFSGNSLTF